MAAFIGNLGEYKEGQEDFESYLERFEQWMIVNEVDDGKQANVFLSVIGAEAYGLLKNLCIPDKPSSLSYDELSGKLTAHYKPKPLIIAERFKFQKRNQQENESVSDDVVSLKRLSTHCDFGRHLDEALRDRFVSGLKVEAIQRKLLTEQDLTFAKACELALSMEMASKNTMEFASNLKGHSTVNKIDKKRETKSAWQTNPAGGKVGSKVNIPFHREQRTSPVTDVVVTIMQHKDADLKQRHAGSVQGSPKDTARSEAEEELFMNTVYSTYTVGKGEKDIKVTVKLEETPIDMQVDTGAAVTLVPEIVYKKHLSHLPLEATKVRLSTFSGENIPLLGTVTVKAKYENQSGVFPLVIVKGDRPALLGRNWLTSFKLDWAGIFSVLPVGGSNDTDVETVLQRHAAVFSEEPGTIRKFKACITVKPDTKPVFRKARPVPYALKEAVEKELNRLEEAGVISKIEHSQWAAPIVVVPKSDKSIRICGDYKVTVNQSVEEGSYPLPTVEDLFATLAGGTLFSKLDLSHAYQQLVLEKNSEKYLVINTHKGLYAYHRLSYGVSSAPSMFQNVMDQILQGLEHVTCFLYDILITGRTRKEHLRNLKEVLSRLENYGVRVKREKCTFMQEKVEYLGHLIDREGLHPTETKVAAIVNAPQPSNVTELRSFLGLLNYYGRFMKDLSTVLQPLHQLLKKEVHWEWTPECTTAFNNAKEQLVKSSVVVHYDTKKPLRLACDASPYGLGAVISHIMENGDEKPIAFASRTLTEAESKYSQIEKEALAIIFGVTKFQKYLYGRKFSLITDHKPLLAILGPKSEIPTLAALRMQRWALRLMAYDYSIEYRTSAENANADALSRLPKKGRDNTAEENEIFYFSVVNELPVQATEIAQSTLKDSVLRKVLELTRMGWPNYIKDETLKPYFTRRNELSVEQGCILWGIRVIIPPAHREQLLHDLHQGHPGGSKMKNLARSYLWWPQLDKDIEHAVQQCNACQSVRKLPEPAPLHCWQWPTRVWQRIHIDFAEKEQHNFLVLVDSHSKWLEVIQMKTTTAAKTIEVLRNIFSSYGLPEEIVSDNGPQFTSQEYKAFLQNNGIKQTLVPAYHPASNGAAERAVQTVKASLQKQVLDEKKQNITITMQHRLANFLFSYRCTPHSVTGCTPAELFLKRQIRTRFSLLKPDLAKVVDGKQQKQKYYHDRPASTLRHLSEGDSVLI
uniref:Gypsy retrotransposon integrase-like protein 1 n=1 Tax=Nothobranchius rachovii TaxID=451742 RepID=A0A1A8QZH2_9TELE